jgi:hypothetical protein
MVKYYSDGLKIASKFFTREDKMNVHKIMGLYCIVHYLYRFALALYCMATTGGTGNGGFDGSILSIITIIPHFILSVTSLFFHIPAKQANKPMI